MKLSIVQSFKDSRLTLWNAIDFQVHLKSLSFYEICDEMVHAYPYALILIHVLWTTKICLEIKLFNVCIQYIRKNGTSQCTRLKWCCHCCFFHLHSGFFVWRRRAPFILLFHFILQFLNLYSFGAEKKRNKKENEAFRGSKYMRIKKLKKNAFWTPSSRIK